MQRLILQLRETTSRDCLMADWWFFDNQTLLKQGTFSAPEDILETEFLTFSEDVVVLAPAHRVHMRKLSLSKAQRRHLGKITPNLMEPYLGQNIESLHFATSQVSEQGVWCYAVEHDLMALWHGWLDSFAQAQVTLLALPSVLKNHSENDVNEVLGESFQFASQQWCWLPKALLGTTQIKSIDVQDLNRRLEQSKDWQRDNLLQGQYKVSTKKTSKTSSWARLACLVALTFIAYTVDIFLESQALDKQARQIEGMANNAFLELVPEEGRVVNLSRQLSARLTLSEQAEPKAMTAYEVLALLDTVKEPDNEELGLQSIAWQSQECRFEWRTASRKRLEQIQQSLEQEGLAVELEQTIRQGDAYLGVFRSASKSMSGGQG